MVLNDKIVFNELNETLAQMSTTLKQESIFL